MSSFEAHQPEPANGASLPAHPTNGSVVHVNGVNGYHGTLLPKPAHHPPSALTEGPTPWKLLHALRQRLALALSLGVLLGSIAAAATFFLWPDPKHTAEVRLYVYPEQPRIGFYLDEARPDQSTFMRTQTVLLRSRPVLLRALRQPRVSELPIIREQPPDRALEWLEGNVHADFGLSNEILRVYMVGHRMDELAVITAEVAKAYLQEVVAKETERRNIKLRNLKGVVDKYAQRLKDKREYLRSLAEEVGVGSSEAMAIAMSYAQDQLGRAEIDLMNRVANVRNLRLEIKLYENAEHVEVTVPPSMIMDEMNKDEFVRKYSAEITKLETNIRATRAVLGSKAETNPVLKGLEADLKKKQADLEGRREELRKPIEDQLRAILVGQKKEFFEQRRREIEQQEHYIKLLNDEVKKIREQTKSRITKSLDMSAALKEIQHWETIYEKLTMDQAVGELELEAPPRIRPFYPEEPVSAEIYYNRSMKRQIMATIAAGLGVLTLVMLGISWLEFGARRVNTVDEVAHGLGIRLVGALPDLSERSRQPALADEPENGLAHNIFTESIDSTRTMLLHASDSESLRAIMVASAMAGEGKTSLASHLAISLARAGRRTLLVDGDLRRPAIHQLFELNLEPGFSEVLRQEVELLETIQTTSVDGLWVLPAGRCDSRSIQALSQRGTRAVLDRLKEYYDFIVIDSAPVLPMADALLLGQHVDAVLLSVLKNVSQIPKVYAAHSRLVSLGIRVLGAVIHGVRGDAYGSSYAYDSSKSGT